MNDKGEIFELQVEPLHDSALDKEGLCTCSDCATDDTGYGTDNDNINNLSRLEDNEQEGDITAGITTDADGLNNLLDVGTINFRGESDIGVVEGDIDSLFTSVNSVHSLSEIDSLKPETFNLPNNLEDIFANGFDESNVVSTKSKYEKKSVTMTNPDSSSKVVRRKDLPKATKETDSKTLNDSNCSCNSKESNREGDSLFGVEKTVVLRLKYLTSDVACGTTELCEQLLGITPGHFSSVGGNKSRRKDKRVKVRGLVPTGVSAKQHEIKAGDWLKSINDQDVSWDNLDSILQVLLYQKKVRLVLQSVPRQKATRSEAKQKAQSRSDRLVHLITGSNNSSMVLKELTDTVWEPFYGALYLSLDGVSSDTMQGKEDIVYQFPSSDNKVIDVRGMFITLAGALYDTTGSTVHSTTMILGNKPIHIVYHSEGSDLFVVSAPQNRFSLSALEFLVRDLIRLLQILHGSVHDAFNTSTNHKQLDCFFALLHQSEILHSKQTEKGHSLTQSVEILPLPNEIKVSAERVLSDFEAADFGDMSDSYYGCRRSYSILGSCLFYKNYLITNHLPKEDLIDFKTYLRYHSLLTLASDQSLSQLVVWKEIYPTRQCHTVGDEQSFGYTEPLLARWFWLIVGYKHMIFCVMLESGGCTAVKSGVSAPDPFLIDQSRAVLMQLEGINMSSSCHNSLLYPDGPVVAKPDHFLHQKHKLHVDLLAKAFKKSSSRDSNNHIEVESSPMLRRVLNNRKDSLGSDNSSESSGSESFFKVSKKGRLFPEMTESLQNIYESKEDIGPVNSKRKLTVGIENCLFHFQYLDNLEGVLVSSDKEGSGASQLSKDISQGFHRCCQQIKHLFDAARKIKEQRKDGKSHILGLNQDFASVREEGIMFVCPSSATDKTAPPLSYWVVGRCLSRSLRREVYVCFHESTPQTVIELAFKVSLGYLPL